ncbi:MCP four helix bundle domain-containing protein, partial [Methylobacter sp.]
MTVIQKMLLMVVSALVGIGGLAGVGQYQMQGVYDKANFANINVIPSIILLDEATASLANMRAMVYQHILQKDQAKRSELEQKMGANRKKVDEALTKYEPLLADDKDKVMLKDDRTALAAYDSLREKVMELNNANRNDEARDLLLANQAVLSKLWDVFMDHRQYNVVLATQSAEAAVASKQSAVAMSLSIALLTLLVIAAIGFFITRALMRQLGGEPDVAFEIANRFAVGDFSTKIELKAGDTDSLFAAMQRISTAIQALVADAGMLAVAAVEGRLQTRA